MIGLWVSQLATFTAGAVVGGLLVYWTMTARARHLQGDTMTGQTKERGKAVIVIGGLAVILVVFGLQVRDSRNRDQEFRDQQACLNRFSISVGEYLTDTLNKRVIANAALTKAQKRLTNAAADQALANTNVVLAVAGAVKVPPTADRDDFLAALHQFEVTTLTLREASKAYTRVETMTKDTLGTTGTPAKPYDPPKVDCKP